MASPKNNGGKRLSHPCGSIVRQWTGEADRGEVERAVADLLAEDGA